MRRIAIAASLAVLCAAAGPVTAQSYQARQRWDQAQQRYSRETQTFNYERDLYVRSGGRPQPYGQQGYQQQAPQGYYQGQQQQGYYQGQPQGYDQRQPQGQYAPPPRGYSNDDRDENGYDASRYYRSGSNYQPRQLSSNDRVYAGSDGRYYCKRNDGTTGLIVGAAGGGILGNVIDGGHSRTAGTLIGGALGALLGKTVQQQSNKSIECQ